ncbi:AraC family transcriptional regulator [Sphingobacterium bambusae]|uniref:Helix-turn-helix domain-containing protein n=1 Tax=Sphingobacterium bambusae TaxID=662858 RepID=A0ABW6BGK4_9SPHI|nr:AraC family transcriptional regulator [Sphingobacterium bambusae]WPL49558.1 AraC family transcriptional regulator [Sphingobacterium bambusae]
MESYYRYLPTSGDDDKWGLTLLNVGCGEVVNCANYPLTGHPEPYQFQWKQGRRLQEYQLIYISKGTGIFESQNGGLRKVSAGTMILLFPGEWHRYRPDSQTGWVEYWVGFKGSTADTMLEHSFFYRNKPVIQTGLHPGIVSLYQDIMTQTRSELPGYQPLVAGMVAHLLGLVYALIKQQRVERESGEHVNLVQQAMVLIRENTETKITLMEIAEQLKLGYSLFRKIFKRHTGLAPGQYLTQLKIERAKSHLLYSEKRVKEIAYALNFESEYYFSKFFKDKTGLSPMAFKKTYAIVCPS